MINQQIESIFVSNQEQNFSNMNKNNHNIVLSNACCVCFTEFGQLSNTSLQTDKIKCQSCKLKVHRLCYSPSFKGKQITCDLCQAKKKCSSKFKCCICGDYEGMMKKVENTIDKYAHVICLLFSPLYLVKSYSELSFVQINYANYQSKNFVCRLCSRLGEILNSCNCSHQGCNEKVHWKCLFENQKTMEQNFWVHSLKRLNMNNKSRYNLQQFYKRIQAYLPQYFGEFDLQFNSEYDITKQSLGLKLEQFHMKCAKHSKNAGKLCFCEKQSQSSLVFCHYCQCLNHTQCQQISQNQPQQQYKCVQCKNWKKITKKKERPYLQIYPNMNLFDYIYIHKFYEDQHYQLSSKQWRLIKRLPLSPSLHFYSNFLYKYFYDEQSTQSSIQYIRVYIQQNYRKRKQKSKKLKNRNQVDKETILKSVMLVKILLSDFDNLGKLRDLFTDWQGSRRKSKQKSFEKQQLEKILNQVHRKFNKQKNNQILQQQTVQEVEDDKLLQKYMVQTQSISCQPQKMPEIIDIEMECQIINQTHLMSPKHEPQVQDFNIKIQDSFIPNNKQTIKFHDIQSCQKKVVENSNIKERKVLLKQIKQLRSSDNINLAHLQRDIEFQITEQQQKTNQNNLFLNTSSIFKLMCIKTLQMDLLQKNNQIDQNLRQRILKYCKQMSQIVSNFEVVRLVQIQQRVSDLIIQLNKLNNLKFSFISNFCEVKLTVQNIALFFTFFSKCRNLFILNYRHLSTSLHHVASKLISTNMKRLIKTIQQIQAYETILLNFDIVSEWLTEQLQKKQRMDKLIFRIKEQISTLWMLKVDKSQIMELRHIFLLNSQTLREALSECEYNNMPYYVPIIQNCIIQNNLFEKSLKILPFQHLFSMHIEDKNLLRINGNQLVEIRDEMTKYNMVIGSQFGRIIQYFAQKYQKQSNKMIRFLNKFSENIINSKKKENRNPNEFPASQQQTEVFKYEQIVKELEILNKSIFDHKNMIDEVSDILYVYRCLQKQINELANNDDEQRRRILNDKINTIPVRG